MLLFEYYSEFDIDALAKQLIGDDLKFSAQDKKIHYRNSQKQILIKCVIQEALKYAKERNLYNKQFYDLCEQGISIVWELHCSLVMDTDNDPNLWKHKITSLEELIKGKTPDFVLNRKSVKSVTADYLNLPYRCVQLERIFVDVLIAAEMFAFVNDVFGPPMPWPFPRSTWHDRHALSNYAIGLLLSAVVSLAPAYGLFLLGGIIANWLAGILVAVFAINAIVSTAFLPISWRRQSKARQNLLRVMQALFATYNGMVSEGALGTKRIRELVSKAEHLGVLWPGPLYAILDHNLSKSGRL